MLNSIKNTLKDPKFQKAVMDTVLTIVVAVAIKVVVNTTAAAIQAGIARYNDSNIEITV